MSCEIPIGIIQLCPCVFPLVSNRHALTLVQNLICYRSLLIISHSYFSRRFSHISQECMQRWMGGAIKLVATLVEVATVAIKLVATLAEVATVAGSGYDQQLQWHLAAAVVAAVGSRLTTSSTCDLSYLSANTSGGTFYRSELCWCGSRAQCCTFSRLLH